jgi:integrase
VKLPKLRPENIEQWHAALLANGLSARTVGHAHRVLSLVLKRAIENGTLARNVAAIRKPPAVQADEVNILTPDQIAVVLDSLRGHSLHPIVRLALATGARRGELLALEWGDIDLGRGMLRVERSVEETRAGGLRVKPPKTRHGRRTITLPSETVAMLRAHKVNVLEVRLVLGLGNITADTLLFSTIGLPSVSFHSLRHAHASVLIRAGVDVLTVSRRLGHSKAHITLDTYGHLVEGADAAAAKAIEDILK